MQTSRIRPAPKLSLRLLLWYGRAVPEPINRIRDQVQADHHVTPVSPGVRAAVINIARRFTDHHGTVIAKHTATRGCRSGPVFTGIVGSNRNEIVVGFGATGSCIRCGNSIAACGRGNEIGSRIRRA